jgi:hypothetical protein
MAFNPYLLIPLELLLHPFGAVRRPNGHPGAALRPEETFTRPPLLPPRGLHLLLCALTGVTAVAPS